MKSLLFIFLLFTSAAVYAQNNEGKITYEETVKMEIDIPEEHREQLKAILPSEQKALKVLIFNAEESLYKDVEGANKDQVVEAGSAESGLMMKMVIEQPDNELYKNISKNNTIEKQEFFGRDFLIVDESTKHSWKLANEQKDILGHTCQKAVFDEEDTHLVAWFTSDIPVSNGPMSYGQLPGMILELDINEGQTHVVATEISLMKLEKNTINAPSKGKKVNRAEYDQIVADKQKEMEEEYGNSGGRMIIRHGGH
jgi:GLPGLI family protein